MKNIINTIKVDGTFHLFLELAQTADWVETLSGPGPFTVFIPTDEAFAKLDQSSFSAMKKDRNRLRSLITHHVIADKVESEDIIDMEVAKAMNGQLLTIEVEDSRILVNEATILRPDIVCSNGVIHVIDSVFLPEGIK
jgi:uncharacterized surface protein with fasciclin (FAS1) repeats